MPHHIVSKAEQRSSKIKIEQKPESAASSKSFVTLIRAISVLCWEQKADWNFSNRSLLLKKAINCNENGSLEISLKLFKTETSRVGFFKSGLTRACLKQDGKMPVDRERLTTVKMSEQTV